MMEPIATVQKSEPRRWPRLGLRGLVAAVLIVGAFLGWLGRMQSEAWAQDAMVAELARGRVLVNDSQPTYLCLFLMKLHGTDSRAIETKYRTWVSPAWFSRPTGFNAGQLTDEEVPHIVERLRQFGSVWEVAYTEPSVAGLRIFFLDRVPHQTLGPAAGSCIVTRH